jgi:hypothetical protein
MKWALAVAFALIAAWSISHQYWLLAAFMVLCAGACTMEEK